MSSPDKAQRAAIRGISLLALRLAGLRFMDQEAAISRLALRLAGLRIGAMGSRDKAQRAAIREFPCSRCA
ncbi:hypothetical protein LRM35_04690 [Klebsiella variicola subsp. variicola]|nr:hypothetical protein LRM35_04690 [Klebsiella variicola subsp. variicola]